MTVTADPHVATVVTDALLVFGALRTWSPGVAVALQAVRTVSIASPTSARNHTRRRCGGGRWATSRTGRTRPRLRALGHPYHPPELPT